MSRKIWHLVSDSILFVKICRPEVRFSHTKISKCDRRTAGQQDRRTQPFIKGSSPLKDLPILWIRQKLQYRCLVQLNKKIESINFSYGFNHTRENYMWRYGLTRKIRLCISYRQSCPVLKIFGSTSPELQHVYFYLAYKTRNSIFLLCGCLTSNISLFVG